MFIALAILLSAVALFAVAYPIVLRADPTRPAAASAQEALDELLAQREAAFQALRELNFDRQVGKITEDDFTAFETNLKLHAADVLRALDRWEAQADDELDGLVERAVRQRRAAQKTGDRLCPACGQPAAPEDKFCAGCGATLPVESAPATAAAAELACPACGLPFQPGDRFCAGCGQALSTAGG